MQTAISSNGFLKIAKQIAKWGSGYIRKKEKKNFSHSSYVDSILKIKLFANILCFAKASSTSI